MTNNLGGIFGSSLRPKEICQNCKTKPAPCDCIANALRTEQNPDQPNFITFKQHAELKAELRRKEAEVAFLKGLTAGYRARLEKLGEVV